MAIQSFHSMEFPPGSGFWIKVPAQHYPPLTKTHHNTSPQVMYAEPQATRLAPSVNTDPMASTLPPLGSTPHILDQPSVPPFFGSIESLTPRQEPRPRPMLGTLGTPSDLPSPGSGAYPPSLQSPQPQTPHSVHRSPLFNGVYDSTAQSMLEETMLLHHSSMSAGDAQELLAMQASLSMGAFATAPDSNSFGDESAKGSLTYEGALSSPRGLPRSPAPASPEGAWKDPGDAAPTTPGPSDGRASLSDDSTVVYTVLSRPLPDYTLRFVFEKCGRVEAVELLGDQRVGTVKFATPDAVPAALQLDGSELMGERLHVARTAPPLVMAAREGNTTQCC